MAPLYFTRARLRRAPALAAIGSLLLPSEASARVGAAHQLVWSLFAGDPGAVRDFLWREDQHGTFYILSSSLPGESPVFEAETKEFAPALAAGDRLRFSLRANATRSIKAEGAARGKRADVVMAALKAVPKAARAEARPGLIADAGSEWLAAQGERHGFALTEDAVLHVDGYDQLRLARPDARAITVSVLEFEGILQLTDPVRFLAALAKGFGHAKAFGCGLMLIRRV
jgi:CRISPR system Cascade subunit CasE